MPETGLVVADEISKVALAWSSSINAGMIFGDPDGCWPCQAATTELLAFACSTSSDGMQSM